MENQTKSWDFNLLKSHICEVTFTKVNGEERTMQCTLKEDLLPKLQTDKSNGVSKKRSDGTLSVWDVDRGEWRSFRIANVKNLKIL